MGNPSDRHLRILEKPQITCCDFEELLGDYVEEDLLPTLHVRLQGHLEECPSCRQGEREYRQVIELAQSLQDRPIPEEVQERLRKALHLSLGVEFTPR